MQLITLINFQYETKKDFFIFCNVYNILQKTCLNQERQLNSISMRFSMLPMFMLLVLSSSCSIPTHSVFPVDKIYIGSNKLSIISLCGKPFRSDSYIKGDKKTDILYYKEPARIFNQGFIITTTLTFENDSLKSIKQEDKNIENINLSLDSIHSK